MTELLQLCDVVRDDTLPELGVRLEDHEGNGTETFILCPRVVFHPSARSNKPSGSLCVSRSAHGGEAGGQGDVAEGERGEEAGEVYISHITERIMGK